MDRRLIITALAAWPAARLLGQEQAARPRHKISAGELHDALSAWFPVRFALGGLLELQVSAPRLLLLPSRQRLGATLVIQAGGVQLRPVPAGELDVVFALRYAPVDQTLRAYQLDVLDLRWPGLPSDMLALLRSVLPALAREAVGEVVLHRFTPRELAVADTMGFEPGEIEVVEDGLVILFKPKPLR